MGTKDFDGHAGWMVLAVFGSGAPAEDWHETVSDLLFDLGWRTKRDSNSSSAHSPTLAVLEKLAGATRTGWRITGVDPALAASSRLAIRPR